MSRTVLRTLALPVLLAVAVVSVAGCGQGGEASPGDSPAKTQTASKPPEPKPLSLQPPSYDGYERLPVLMYHHVDPALRNEVAMTPEHFAQQLAYLRDNGYTSITARDLHSHHTTGTPLPAKPVMITFDDGWKNQYTYALPLLREYGFTATFFLNPQKIGRGSAYMTREMVVEMANTGHDIESHTWWHMSLVRPPGVTPEEFEPKVAEQLTLDREWIEQATGMAPVALCYPYGNYDLEAAERVEKAGYSLAFTTDEGIADAREWDRLALKRMAMTSTDSIDIFGRRLARVPLPARNIDPAPGSHVATTSLTLTADITGIDPSVTGIKFSAGPTTSATSIVTKDGRTYATATITNVRVGSRSVILSGNGTDGIRHMSSWMLQVGF